MQAFKIECHEDAESPVTHKVKPVKFNHFINCERQLNFEKEEDDTPKFFLNEDEDSIVLTSFMDQDKS